MAFEHIRKIIADGEGLTVEFKDCVNGLNNSVWETVCSFSNRYGGHLLLGVRDDGEILGVNRAAAAGIKKNFANMLNNPQKTSPSLYLSLDEAELDGRLILHAYIPVSSQIQSCSGRIYDRNEDGDFDITNSAELVAHLSIRKRNQFTEREVFPYATLDDLRLDLIPVVKKMAAGRVTGHPWKDMTEMELLKSAGLYETDKRTGKTGFNRAAILLLGREEVIQQVAPGYVTDCLLRINLVHREFSGTFPARIIIEKDRLVAENWNRALRHGRIDPESFEPYPKNPTLARFFVNIGYADTLGSGVRNLMKYTKLYSGGEPELIEGEIFRTIIPLGLNTPASLADKLPIKVADKLPIKVADKLTASEMEFIKLLGQYLDEYEWITNAKAREITGKSEGSVKRFLRNLAGKDVLEIQGENKNRQYRLRK